MWLSEHITFVHPDVLPGVTTFTPREKRLLAQAVKPLRFDSEEHAALYEKVSNWQSTDVEETDE